jgi:ketosteroid isomerase-like protein
MKRNILCACLFALITTNLIAQEKVKIEKGGEKVKIKSENIVVASVNNKPDSVESKLLESLSVKWMDAMLNHDSAMLIKLMSPDYQLHSWDGKSAVPRERWIFNLLNRLRITKWEQTNIHAKVYGNVAVVNSLYKWTGTHTDRPFESEGFLTDVWIKVGNNWQVMSRSSGISGDTQMK